MSVHDAAQLDGRSGGSGIKKALSKLCEEIDKAEGKDDLGMKGAASLRSELDRLCEAVSLELRASESSEPAPVDDPKPEVEEEEVEEEEVEDSE